MNTKRNRQTHHEEASESVNLGNEANKKEARIGTTLTVEERQDLIELWTEQKGVLAGYTTKSHKCQTYANQMNLSRPLHDMSSSWPFSMWGTDVIESISPKVSNGHQCILVMIDYSTK